MLYNEVERKSKKYFTRLMSYISNKNPNIELDDEFKKAVAKRISEEVNLNTKIKINDYNKDGIILNLAPEILNEKDSSTIIMTEDSMYVANNIYPIPTTYTTADDITFTSAVSHHLDNEEITRLADKIKKGVLNYA